MSARRSITLDERDILVYTHGTREALHSAVNRLYIGAKDRVAISPDQVDEAGELKPRLWRLTFGEVEDDTSLAQKRFYFGPVLGQIAEQGRRDGRAWDQQEWHSLFKRIVLGYEIVKEKVAGRKRPTVYRRLRSIKHLTVKQMSLYLDEVIALATTELGVTFVFDEQERDAARYKKPVRKASAKQPEEATT